MRTYTIRGQLTGTLYGRHLSATEAAAVVLRHATRRFIIGQAEEGYYWLWVERCRGGLEIAYSQDGYAIGARALTKELAWEAMAPQILEVEWPGIQVWPEDEPSLRLVWDRNHAA
jgi:hypothetical protein